MREANALAALILNAMDRPLDDQLRADLDKRAKLVVERAIHRVQNQRSERIGLAHVERLIRSCGRQVIYNCKPLRYSRKGPPRSCRRSANSTVALRNPSLS